MLSNQCRSYEFVPDTLAGSLPMALEAAKEACKAFPVHHVREGYATTTDEGQRSIIVFALRSDAEKALEAINALGLARYTLACWKGRTPRRCRGKKTV
jgi:hypothetical protein